MKSIKSIYFCVLLSFVLAALLLSRRTWGGSHRTVSIINLIATPQKYHDELVMVEGFAVLEVEHQAIYLSREDGEYGITMNGLWLDVDDEQFRSYCKYTQSYVLIEGKFDSNSHGHLGSFLGTITGITRFEKLGKVVDKVR